MPKKKQTAIFLDVYLDENKKETFREWRFSPMEIDGKTVNSIQANERAQTESGNPKRVAINRAARRIRQAKQRRLDRRSASN